jgi:predicted flap endonuclease-1-like 5' DNA nuclease
MFNTRNISSHRLIIILLALLLAVVSLLWFKKLFGHHRFGNEYMSQFVHDTRTATPSLGKKQITKGTVFFPTGKTIITSEGSSEISKIVTTIPDKNDCNVLVTGYASTHGNSITNEKLSIERAQVVQQQLIAQGINPESITVKSAGPVKQFSDTGHVLTDKHMNQRVEIVVGDTDSVSVTTHSKNTSVHKPHGFGLRDIFSILLPLLFAGILGYFWHKYRNYGGGTQSRTEVHNPKVSAVASQITADDSIEEFEGIEEIPAVEPVREDDLIIIEGIGPKIKELLRNAGIVNFAQLADTPVSRLQEILDAAGPNYRHAHPRTWPEQSVLARDGKMDELKALQDILIGGI